MYLTIRAIVLRVTDYNDRDALLTVLSRDHGKLTIKARGLRRKNSPLIAPCQLLAYGEFTLFEYKGQYTINEDSIFFDQVGATLRISEDMEIEFAVMEALGMCTTLSVQDSDMYANDIFGNNVMILKRQ